MDLLIFIGFLGLIYYSAKKSKENAARNKRLSDEAILRQRNSEWVRFILDYRSLAKTEPEKKLMNRIVDDMQEQGLVGANEGDWLENNQDIHSAAQPSGTSRALPASVAAQADISIDSRELARQPKDAHAARLDNISLLLYFGAFLFVAAVGLFVAFAGASGWIRTLAVLLVTLALYVAGQWVYRTKPALRPAGLAFVGIGVAIAPLVGVAAYNYIASSNSEVVWFATSIFCLGLYGHAVISLKKPLINYIFIFTLLSLFESGVAVLDVPIYYFGWAMAAVGLFLQVIGISRKIWPDFRESSRAGSRLYMPLAVLVSLVIIPAQGYGQLGVSLLLASLYYGLEGWRSSREDLRESYALVAHGSLLAGLLSLFYGSSGDVAVTGVFLAALSLVHVVVLLLWRSNSQIMQNIASLMLASTLASIAMLAGQHGATTIALALCAAQSLFVWWRQRRDDAYMLAALSWTALPIVFGNLALEPALSISQLTVLAIAALMAHIAFYLVVVKPRQASSSLEMVRSAILVNVTVVVSSIFFTSPGVALGAFFATSLAILILSLFDKDTIWEIVSGIVISLAVVRCWSDGLLLSATMVALAYNILLALRFRSEVNRWISTGLWLLWPIGLGGLTTSQHWMESQYAWAYVAVMLGLVISRAIARGAVFPSAKIPMAAYTRTASLSYVYGYVAAGGLALILSLFANNIQLHTTGILGVVSFVVFALAWSIEKQPSLMALQPVLWQLMLISGLQPKSSGPTIELFVILSSLLAVACYGAYRLLEQDKNNLKYITSDAGEVAVIASFVAPGSILFASSLGWAMPIGLAVAGLLLFDYWRKQSQGYREIAVAIMVAAVMWELYYFGVRETQVYAHILALMFAGFAWWRNSRQDKDTSDSYIYAALTVATVPLLLQALSGTAGDLYGWWLLLEQVVIMLIGMALRKRFVIMWGLYVAVGSVLYQLRHLGYAALAVLAIFVIGIAVYQLQKYNKPDQ